MIELNYDFVNGFSGDTSFVLYTTLDKNRHDNKFAYQVKWDLANPYLLFDSEYLKSKKFYINNKLYMIHLFNGNTMYHDGNEWIYYSPEFGVLVDKYYGDTYRKLIKIENGTLVQNEIATKLADQIVNDTTPFYKSTKGKPLPFRK